MFLLLLSSYIIFIISSHPLILGLSVIFQSLMTAILLNNKMLMSWFSFIIFIVFLGGILMLFSYFISMINMKELFFLKNNSLKFTIIFFTLMYFFSLYYSFDFVNNNSFYLLNYSDILFIPFSSSFKISIFFMYILLLIMVVVIFLIESSKGMMRSI